MKTLLVAAAAAALSWPGALFAQAYPAKPVRYLVPFPAGGSPDIVARLLGERLNRLWGQPVVVENRSGAGGTVAAAFAAKATPDGYTLFQCNIASNAIADLLGGQIPVAIANVPALLPPVQAGRIRALAVTGAKRASQWPSVPTMAESGMTGYDVTSWYGLCAPAGTPRPIIDKVHADLSAVLLAPDVQQRMNDMVIDAAPTSPEEFAAFIRSETSRWAKVVKDAGIAQQ